MCKYDNTIVENSSVFALGHISVMQLSSLLWELACHMGSHSVIYHPANVLYILSSGMWTVKLYFNMSSSSQLTLLANTG